MSTSTMKFHCTTCPSECQLTVTVDEAGEAPVVVDVAGNRCPRGDEFARQEITCPVRVLTSTVPIAGGDIALLPVRTREAIPRALSDRAMDVLRSTRATAPIKMGAVVVSNILGTGVDVIASLDVDEVR